jgi:hypothetical protein
MQNTTPLKVDMGRGNEGMPEDAAALVENAATCNVAAAVVALAVEEPLQVRVYLGLEFPGLEGAVALCPLLSPADARTIAESILNVLDSPEFKARLSEAG